MNRNTFLELKIPPLVVFAAFASFMWLLALAVPFAGFILLAKKPIALDVAAVGGVFAAGSILSFLRAKTTLSHTQPAKSALLVTTGVFAITRNPMYLSLLFVLAGWAIYLSNFTAPVVIPLFIVYLNRFQIKPEERALAALFGREFDEYCKRVKRWL